MSTNAKSKFGLRAFYSQKVLVFVSLLFVIVLASSCFASAFSSVSPFVLGAPDRVVKNENELKNAVDTATGSAIIALDNDITLTEALKIPANKDITLTSNKANGYYKLIGAEGMSTIFVDDGGVLRLDGIIVTHVKNAGPMGGGVYVEVNGLLIMYSGEISSNDAIDWGDPRTPTANGGGVFNLGVFEMYGGKISGNSATGMGSRGGGAGGGVRNIGTFTMFGGEISNNDGHVSGGGVHNTGNFIMSDGAITNNNAGYWGGGVCNNGVFERVGGVISGNTAGVSGADNIYPNEGGNGGGSSNGNGGSGGNGGGSGSGGNGGVSNGNGYSLSAVVIICVSILVVVVGVVAGALFFYFKKKVAQVEAKLGTMSEDKLESK
jgi:hypothetical protein